MLSRYSSPDTSLGITRTSLSSEKSRAAAARKSERVSSVYHRLSVGLSTSALSGIGARFASRSLPIPK